MDSYASHMVAQPTLFEQDASQGYFPILALPPELISATMHFLSGNTILTVLVPSAHIVRDICLDDFELWKTLCQRRFQLPDHSVDADESSNTSSGRVGWFREEDSSSSYSNAWLHLYRCFLLTPPRPLKLRIVHVDDDPLARSVDLGMTTEEYGRVYGVQNLLRPEGKAFCSTRNRNVHVILSLAPTRADQIASAPNDLTTPLLQGGLAASSAASSTPIPQPLPPSFLVTDFKIVAPASGYTSPLSSGFVFFTDTPPTRRQLQQWHDWSEAQWRKRCEEIAANQPAFLEQERTQGPERGELDAPEQKSEDGALAQGDEQQVENWYADVPRPRQAVDDDQEEYPLSYIDPSSGSLIDPPSHVEPLVAFFRLEENGLVLEQQPVALSAAANTNNGVSREEANGHSSTAESTSSSAEQTNHTDASPPIPIATPLDPVRHGQPAFSYRHHFSCPIHGRFLTLTFLRSCQDQANVDVSYFGVKGYRKGMRAASAASRATESTTSAPPAAAESAESTPPPPMDPDSLDDAYDFDSTLPSLTSDVHRLRAYLQSLQRMGAGMATEVATMDAHLTRVQSVLAAQQRAQQQQQALRLRMLLLQTQQLQLQLQNQHLATRATLAHAQTLHERTSSYVTQRRALLDQVEQERETHRRRLEELSEEKQREEATLQDLRRRVQEAKEREESLRDQLRANQLNRERVERERREREGEVEVLSERIDSLNGRVDPEMHGTYAPAPAITPSDPGHPPYESYQSGSFHPSGPSPFHVLPRPSYMAHPNEFALAHRLPREDDPPVQQPRSYGTNTQQVLYQSVPPNRHESSYSRYRPAADSFDGGPIRSHTIRPSTYSSYPSSYQSSSFERDAFHTPAAIQQAVVQSTADSINAATHLIERMRAHSILSSFQNAGNQPPAPRPPPNNDTPQ